MSSFNNSSVRNIEYHYLHGFPNFKTHEIFEPFPSPVPSFQKYQFQDVSVLLVIITPIKTYFVIMFPIISMFPILSMTAEWL